jgi:hypothetical protein
MIAASTYESSCTIATIDTAGAARLTHSESCSHYMDFPTPYFALSSLSALFLCGFVVAVWGCVAGCGAGPVFIIHCRVVGIVGGELGGLPGSSGSGNQLAGAPFCAFFLCAPCTCGALVRSLGVLVSVCMCGGAWSVERAAHALRHTSPSYALHSRVGPRATAKGGTGQQI